MRKLFLAAALAGLSLSLAAQHPSRDLRRLADLAPRAVATASPEANPALDTIVHILAHYAGAPDAARTAALRSGPALLTHYRNNPPLRDYLVAAGLYPLLQAYGPTGAPPPPAAPRRAELTPLTTPAGQVDVARIRRLFRDADGAPLDLRAAAAATRVAMPPPPATLVGAELAADTDWLTRRTREDQTHHFLTELRDALDQDDLDRLFPTAAAQLPRHDLLGYRAALPSLRRAFARDFADLPTRFANFLDARGGADAGRPEVYQLLLLYRTAELAQRGLPPAELMDRLGAEVARARAAVRREMELRLAAADPDGSKYAAVRRAYTTYATPSAPLARLLAATGGLLGYGNADGLARYDARYGAGPALAPPAVERAAGMTAIREALAADYAPAPPPVAAVSQPELLSALRAEQDRAADPALALLIEITAATPATDTARLHSIAQRYAALAATRDQPAPPGPFADAAADRKQRRDRYAALATAVRNYSSGGAAADSLRTTYRNLTTFAVLLELARQTQFLLTDSPALPGTAYADPLARQLLAGLAYERFARAGVAEELSAAGLAELLLGLGQRPAQPRPDAPPAVRAVDQLAATLAALLETELLTDPLNAGARRTLAQQFPAFAPVAAAGREFSALFRSSQTGEYRYAVDHLLDLVRLLDLAPPGGGQRARLTARRAELRRLRAAYDVPPGDDLAALGLPPVDATALPLFSEERLDRERLARYERELSTAPDALAREEVGNSIRDLKLQRLSAELRRVEERLQRLGPAPGDRFSGSLFRYATFMADVAAAANPAALERALTTLDPPAASAQTKRNRPSSFEIGGYLGLSLHRERLDFGGAAPAGATGEHWGAALFAPLGVSYSRQLGLRRSSFTLFGSLVDLGGLTALRFGEQEAGLTVDRFPEFRPRNLIAPGLHLMYNFANSPLTLGLGVQDGPAIRRYTVDGSPQRREARGWRAVLSLTVDVPVFRFPN